MSVQAGTWNFDAKPVDPQLVQDFSKSLKQQAPDCKSSPYLKGEIALLYCPFHTTRESRLERQPFLSGSGIVVTWDGRLDNMNDLIVQLAGESGDYLTDVSVVTAAFDRWGTDCFRRIIGDWAISIWDPGRREIIFAIDFMAVRHIYYHLRTDRISWCTDLTPLVLLARDKFHVDDDYMAGYFAHDPDGDLTPYREIRGVPPGSFVRVRSGAASVDRYWQASPKSRIRYNADEEYEEHFRSLFRSSVRRRLRSDTAILAELSGGLDSSSIVCVADELLEKQGAQCSRLDTLSYYDRTEPSGDDWIYFAKIEAKRGRAGAHIDASEYCASDSLEYPEFTSSPGYLGASCKLEAARASIVQNGGYRVVLSGLGGDEFLGGIPDPRPLLADLILQFRPISLMRQLTAWSLVKRRPLIQLLWQSSLELLPPFLAQHLLKEAKVESWIQGRFATRTHLAIRQIDVADHFGFWLPSRRSCIAGVQLMANKMAGRAIRVGEEARYPYLDKDLIEFILSIPATQLLRPGERRSLMRRALRGIVPEEILSRRTKQFGARTPAVAIDKHWLELEAIFTAPICSLLGYVKGDEFMRTLHAVRNGKIVNMSRLLNTVALEFWLRRMLDQQLIDVSVASHPIFDAPSVARA